MCTQDQLERVLAEVAQRAKERFGGSLDSVLLYGSYARGDADEESDIDIMLLVKQPAELLAVQRKEWSRFGTDLDLKYNVITSLQLQEADTFYAWKDTLPFFRNVASEGVPIHA